jgi:hypothetical protein
MSGFPIVPTGQLRLPGMMQSIYANQLRMSVTVSDITITFGASEDRGVGNLINEDKTSVHLSPVTAKILLINLEKIINVYQNVVGNIPIPQKVVTQIDSQIENLSKMLAEQMIP